MKTTILIHGMPSKSEYYDANYPSPSNSHWFPWISKQLIKRNIHTIALEIPQAYNPQYTLWKKELERFEIDENTILVGHSCGGGFLLRWLSENTHKKVGKVVLVAPWLNPFDEIEEKEFFNFTFDKDLIEDRNIHIFHSTNDIESIQLSLEKILTVFPNFPIRYFQNYGHFCFEDMKTEKFPELLEQILL